MVSPDGKFAFALDYLDSQPGAWILSSGAVNAAGQPVSVMPAACPDRAHRSPGQPAARPGHGGVSI